MGKQSSLLTKLALIIVAIVLASGSDTALGQGKNWEARVKQGEITVMRNGEKMCAVKTELPNVEETRFLKWEGKKCLAVKSRGHHGPAALQLFDAKTGALVGKVMAFAVNNGQPAWAAPWKE